MVAPFNELAFIVISILLLSLVFLLENVCITLARMLLTVAVLSVLLKRTIL